ncbi:hypothetical protein CMV_022907 [Castanea mollissima]|uniref:Uncharacterized protein n=1 Tax=Castanea mollissima TaxID=60419 RepID=A0A8J4QIN2_9ROSI|nr:hypothetical protein CMV_022907 [Castanea mollissima]
MGFNIWICNGFDRQVDTGHRADWNLHRRRTRLSSSVDFSVGRGFLFLKTGVSVGEKQVLKCRAATLRSKTVPIQQVEGIRIIEIANSPDPGHNMRKRKTVPIQLILIVLLIRTLLFKFDAVKVELWDESPECLLAARQNACENSFFGCEKGEDMGEARVW